jgi:hypothetical protein
VWKEFAPALENAARTRANARPTFADEGRALATASLVWKKVRRALAALGKPAAGVIPHVRGDRLAAARTAPVLSGGGVAQSVGPLALNFAAGACADRRGAPTFSTRASTRHVRPSTFSTRASAARGGASSDSRPASSDSRPASPDPAPACSRTAPTPTVSTDAASRSSPTRRGRGRGPAHARPTTINRVHACAAPAPASANSGPTSASSRRALADAAGKALTRFNS